MNIYQTVPYTYFIQWEDGTKYIGSRYAKNCHPSEFFTEGGYFTSSRYVQQKIKTHGLPQIRMILSTWITPKESYDHETLLLECFDASNDPTFLNKHNNSFPYINQTDPDVRENHSVMMSEVMNRPEVKIKQTGINNSQHGKIWISDPNTGKSNKISIDELIPYGWVIGRNVKFQYCEVCGCEFINRFKKQTCSPKCYAILTKNKVSDNFRAAGIIQASKNKKIVIDDHGVQYSSVTDASKILKVHYQTVLNRIKTGKYKFAFVGELVDPQR